VKCGTHNTYPLVRRAYDTLEELADVIGRNRVTAFRKLAYCEFTQRDKEKVAHDLINRGLETDVKETIEKYFGG